MRLPGTLVRPVSVAADMYIRRMRKTYFDRSTRIDTHLRRLLQPFFASETLDRVRITVLHDERMPDPPFYPVLRAVGFRDLPTFRLVAAATFLDVIVSHEEFTPRLLFHELVHAVQYRQLGLQRFVHLYVSGFVRGGGYEGIPLERHAYALDTRFASHRDLAFQVEDDVQNWVRDGKY